MQKKTKQKQLGLRAINMEMKGSVYKQKTIKDPKIGKRFVVLVLSCYVVDNGHEHHTIKKTPDFLFLHKLLERGV